MIKTQPMFLNRRLDQFRSERKEWIKILRREYTTLYTTHNEKCDEENAKIYKI